MTAHLIPPDADLIELVLLNKQWEIEDACNARKAKRTRKSQAGREGYVRGRIEELARRSGRALVSDRAASVPALTGFDPSRDDWDQCPACGFILVACDCDAPTINLERAHAA